MSDEQSGARVTATSAATTLGAAAPDAVAAVWSGKFDGRQAWWCRICERVCFAASITLDDGETFCPYCDSPSDCLYWYHGWPMLVLVGWVLRPVEGQRCPLPVDWLEHEGEEPGCGLEHLGRQVGSGGTWSKHEAEEPGGGGPAARPCCVG